MKGIIPPRIYRSKRGKYPWAQDLFYSDHPHKIVVDKKPNGTVVHLEDKDVEGFLLQTMEMDIVATGTTDTPNYIGLIKEIIDECQADPSKGYFVDEIEIWLELSNMGLSTPVGLTNSQKGDGTQKTWQELSDEQGLVIAKTINTVTPTRYILRTNLNGVYLTMNDLKIIIDWALAETTASVYGKYGVNQELKSVDYKETVI